MKAVLRVAHVSVAGLVLIFAAESGRSLGTQSARSNESHPKEVQAVDRIGTLVHDSHLKLAIEQIKQLEPRIRALHDPELEMRLARYRGAAELGQNRYTEALKSLLSAREMASRAKDISELWAIDGNLAWVYVEMNNLTAAADFAEQSVVSMRQAGEWHPEPLVTRAFITGRLGEFSRAEPLFSEAIDASLEAGNVNLASAAWHLLGDAYLESLPGTAEPLRSNRLSRAEAAETEAFRLRKLNGSADVDQSYRELARILAEKKDFKTASVLMDEAVASMGNPKSTAPIWFFFAARGQLRAMKGDLSGAVSDLRAALELAQRLQIVPTDDDRVTFESGLADLYSLFIDVGNRLYLQNHDRSLRAEVFEAAAVNRAASLAALVPQPNGWRTRLPEEHSTVVKQLADAERKQLIAPDREIDETVRDLRAKLHEIESKAGADEGTGSMTALEVATRALDDHSALLAFHVSDRGSWLWTVTKEEFRVASLPPKDDLARSSERLTQAIRDGDPNWQALSAEIGGKLFGTVSKEVQGKSRWILALDRELYSLPLAAVTWNNRVLIEDHALMVAPGLRLLQPAGAANFPDGPLLGIGDAIYNGADRRLERALPFAPLGHGDDRWHLARLSGSGREVRSARDSWGAGTVLTGADATKDNLIGGVRAAPTILHLATHVVAAPDRSGVIVLGLDASGEPELLNMREIILQSLGRPLVVMSGCASGDARTLPATGLMGLTRAWIGAGAEEVLATRWPALDDSGPFFSDFYGYLRQHHQDGAAEALRFAQLRLLHSSGFRSNPAYWSSYFLVGTV